MTGFIITATALLLGYQPQEASFQDLVDSTDTYVSYYTGETCEIESIARIDEHIVRDCDGFFLFFQGYYRRRVRDAQAKWYLAEQYLIQ